MNILIAEPVSPAGIELLKSQADWNVIVSNPKEYAAHLAEADALVVRSAVQVTKDVLDKAESLGFTRPQIREIASFSEDHTKTEPAFGIEALVTDTLAEVEMLDEVESPRPLSQKVRHMLRHRAPND